jgi:beta-1,4-mannosyltransferase
VGVLPSAPPGLPSKPIRVLSAPGPWNDSTNQTVTMLVESLPDHVEVRTFSWARAFLSHYDVLHVHWPEYVMRHRKRANARVKRALFALLMVRTAVLRTPTVWTVHNARPHERGSRGEQFLLEVWSRRATRRVYMYESALPSPRGRRDVCIPRGDYEPMYGAIRDRGPCIPSSPGTLLLFGVLRPYKGIERLIDAVRGAGDEGLGLLVIGGVFDDSYARELLCANDAKNVTVRIQVLSDEQLAEVIQRSSLVVLPYCHMYNSGAALLSLTLRRPILVPASPTMRELRQEVGENWVHLYEGELTTEHLRRALHAPAPDRGPDLTRRDWTHVGRSYAALYESIVRTRRVPAGQGDVGRRGVRPRRTGLPAGPFRRSPRGTVG